MLNFSSVSWRCLPPSHGQFRAVRVCDAKDVAYVSGVWNLDMPGVPGTTKWAGLNLTGAFVLDVRCYTAPYPQAEFPDWTWFSLLRNETLPQLTSGYFEFMDLSPDCEILAVAGEARGCWS